MRPALTHYPLLSPTIVWVISPLPRTRRLGKLPRRLGNFSNVDPGFRAMRFPPGRSGRRPRWFSTEINHILVTDNLYSRLPKSQTGIVREQRPLSAPASAWLRPESREGGSAGTIFGQRAVIRQGRLTAAKYLSWNILRLTHAESGSCEAKNRPPTAKCFEMNILWRNPKKKLNSSWRISLKESIFCPQNIEPHRFMG